jgi:hypothetical protein
MISSIVWCAMIFSGNPVHAEGIVLATGNHYYTVRFNKEIIAVRRTSCDTNKPKGSSYVPLHRRHK